MCQNNKLCNISLNRLPQRKRSLKEITIHREEEAEVVEVGTNLNTNRNKNINLSFSRKLNLMMILRGITMRLTMSPQISKIQAITTIGLTIVEMTAEVATIEEAIGAEAM